MSQTQKQYLELTYGSIIKVVVVLAVIAFLYLIRDILAIIFFSILLILILQGPVSWMKSKGIPTGLGVIVMYLILISLFALVVVLAIPPITQQAGQIVEAIGQYWGEVSSYLGLGAVSNDLANIQSTFSNLESYLPGATENIFTRLTGVITALVTLFIVLVITFYGLVEESAFKRIMRNVVPSRYLPYMYQVSSRIQRKLGQWLRGQLLLAFAVFALTYFGLLLLGVEYALTLAVITGILEFIPYIGPLLSGALAVFLTVFNSPVLAVLVIVLYIVIQQLENHILVPKIMQKAVGLNPVVSIIALLIGGKLGGVVGLILAIPVATALSVFIQDFVDKQSGPDEVGAQEVV